jgi:hypothetical protein
MFLVEFYGRVLYRGNSLNLAVRYYLTLAPEYPEIELYIGPEL